MSRRSGGGESRQRDPEELHRRLVDQAQLLRRAAQSFDEGLQAEAVNIAARIRVLCHSGQGPPLLKQLGLLKILWFYDTAGPLRPPPRRHGAVTSATFRSRDSVVTGTEFRGDRTAVPFAHFDDLMSPAFPSNALSPPGWSRFPAWWRTPLMAIPTPSGADRDATRADLVLWLAHDEGGAHISRTVGSDDDDARRAVAWAFTSLTGTSIEQRLPIGHVMRQLAHEVLVTLEDETAVEPPLPEGRASLNQPPRPPRPV